MCSVPRPRGASRRGAVGRTAGGSGSRSRQSSLGRRLKFVEQAVNVAQVVLGQAPQQLGDGADAVLAVVGQGLFAWRGQADVDLALVVGVDAAGDEGAVARLER